MQFCIPYEHAPNIILVKVWFACIKALLFEPHFVCAVSQYGKKEPANGGDESMMQMAVWGGKCRPTCKYLH